VIPTRTAGRPTPRVHLALALAALGLAAGCAGPAATHPSEARGPEAAEGWPTVPVTERHARRLLAGHVYEGQYRTAVCNCPFEVERAGDAGAGAVDTDACPYTATDADADSATALAWTRVVPDAALPTGELECWSVEGGGRDWCIRQDPEARAMLLDLHNFVPVVAQIPQYRGTAPLGDVEPGRGRLFGDCRVEVTPSAIEPPDCRKGDLARIWLYMADTYGASLPEAHRELLERWSAADPVSPNELTRAERLAAITGRENPHVQDVELPSEAGSCPGSGPVSGYDG
jgi:deoxyribonuclease-1